MALAAQLGSVHPSAWFILNCMRRWYLSNAQVEALTRREAREALPLVRMLLLYLDPFSLFKDATRGSLSERSRALSYNRSIRWMLLTYVRRWISIGCTFFLGTGLAEAAAAQHGYLIISAAAFGVLFAVSFAVIVYTFAAYLLLGSRSEG